MKKELFLFLFRCRCLCLHKQLLMFLCLFFVGNAVFGQITESEKAAFLRFQERLAPLHQPVKRQENDWLLAGGK